MGKPQRNMIWFLQAALNYIHIFMQNKKLKSDSNVVASASAGRVNRCPRIENINKTKLNLHYSREKTIFETAKVQLLIARFVTQQQQK